MRRKDRQYTKIPDLLPDGPCNNTPWQHFGQKTSKLYRKTMQNVDFEHRLSLKQPKNGQGVSGTNQNVLRQAIPTGISQSILRYAVQQAQVKAGEPLGFARRP